VPVAIALLLMREEALRQDQMQVILGTRHRDIEKTTLFLNLRGVACTEVGRDAAVAIDQHTSKVGLLNLARYEA
jgi:hypothetical protein